MKAWVRTFGCRANQADSETLRAALQARGVTLVDHAAEADVAVFNSCAVTAEAEADLRQGVRRAARENSRLATVVMGCASALDRGAIARLPGVQGVVAGGDVDAVVAALGLPRAAMPVAGPQSGARALLQMAARTLEADGSFTLSQLVMLAREGGLCREAVAGEDRTAFSALGRRLQGALGELARDGRGRIFSATKVRTNTGARYQIVFERSVA